MQLVRRNRANTNLPARFSSDIDELFNGFFGGFDSPPATHRAWPVIDVADEENAIMVRAEVPGCKADDIELSVHGDVLTISGEKKQEKEHKERGYYHVESSYGSFRRDIHLSSDVDASKVEAICSDGILSITLPKAEEAKTIKVKVKD